jgi:hypothetical protein
MSHSGAEESDGEVGMNPVSIFCIESRWLNDHDGTVEDPVVPTELHLRTVRYCVRPWTEPTRLLLLS